MIKFCNFNGNIEICDDNTIKKYGLTVIKEITDELYEQNGGQYYVVGNEIHLGKSDEQILNELRVEREVQCFQVINRGQLWYDNLTDTQKQELKVWYNAWLDVTETRVIPTKPKWLV